MKKDSVLFQDFIVKIGEDIFERIIYGRITRWKEEGKWICRELKEKKL